MHQKHSNHVDIVLQLIAITVEDEEDIAKFKDYTPSSDGGTAASEAKESSTPAPPKKEVVNEPVKSPEPAVPEPSTTTAEDRTFASPLARKIAEENDVCSA